MKILNLYAGIGGNRKLWGDKHEVTAVEINPTIAFIYKEFFPKDKVIVGDAHKYLLEHYQEFGFIWSSPPCPSHSRMRLSNPKKIYANLGLYQEILFLKHHFKGKWVVENVVPYYEPLIKPSKVLHRHCFWSNFSISNKDFRSQGTCKIKKEREHLQKVTGFNLDNFKGVDKRLLLRNCVVPELGKHVFDCVFKEEQKKLEE